MSEIKTSLKIQNIPTEIKNLPQWVCWKSHNRNGRMAKVPINPSDGTFAKTNDKKTWSHFEKALACCDSNGFDGVGFVFSENDDFVGVDIDKCIDPDTGELISKAVDIVRTLDSYTEVSPSGKGLHILVKGKLPGDGIKRNGVEVYDKNRFFTMTGHLYSDANRKIEKRENELKQLYQEAMESKAIREEDRILSKARKAENGDKFKRLWKGDFSDYPSQSEADLALCRMLNCLTHDDIAMTDRLFRESGLYRQKWDEPHLASGQTYGEMTIAKARNFGSGYQATPQPKTPDFNLTDLGNAERLVHHASSKIRYCHAWKSWLIWDGTRWSVDKTDQVRQIAKEVVRSIYSEAEREPDDRKRQEIVKHAMKSESEKRIRSMILLAQSELPVTPEQLDVNPWLLACLNGTIDLKTGKLLPHDREHFISQLAPIHYDPNQGCPLWVSFLDRIMDGNKQLIDFLQRAIGYSLTGETSEQCLFIFYGSGANGKTTFLQTIQAMMGEYAQQTPTETLLVKRRGAIPNDVARLKGRRFVTASEAESEQRFAESLIKQMTGGDTLSARFLHQEWFDFVPSHKIFLGTNHKPVIKGTDHAIWRRIKLVPFEVTIPEKERDIHLANKLKAEFPGIMAWAVEGCLKWQEEGLGTPDEVKTATEDYRNEMDVLSEFLSDCCIENDSIEVSTKDLYEIYFAWCEKNGDRPLPKRTLGLKLKERGFKPGKVNRGQSRGWRGLGLKP